MTNKILLKINNYATKDIEVYQNPNIDDLIVIFKKSNNSLRGFINNEGDLYVWNSEHALHGEIDLYLDTEKYIPLQIYDTHTEILESDVKTVRKYVLLNKTLKDLEVHKNLVLSNKNDNLISNIRKF